MVATHRTTLTSATTLIMRHINLLTFLLFSTLGHAAEDSLSVLPAELDDGPKSLMLHRYLLKQANEALDRREKVLEKIEAAAPSCYLTSMRSLTNVNGPQDAEQNIFGQLAFGMTHAEYVMMHAAKPH
jgi:hypothetical protein